MSRVIRTASVLIAVVSLLVASSTALAATRVVPSALYPTIQAAEDAAMPGDTISIRPGVYEEEVTVDVPDLTITGVCYSPGLVIMEGLVSGTGLTIDADDVNVRCLTMRHYDDSIYVNYDGLDVYRVHFRGAEDDAIDGYSDGFRITSCEFWGIDDNATDLNGDGGTITGSKVNGAGYGFEVSGDDLRFTDNDIQQLGHGSCLDYDGDNGSIERTYCSVTGDYGLDVDGSNNVVRHNRTRTTEYQGIYVDGDDNIVDYNEVENSEDYGIEVCGDDNKIRWNTVNAVEDACFYIDGENPFVEGNAATNCVADGGFEIDGDLTLVVKDNTVDGANGDYGMDIDCRGAYTGIPPYYYEPCVSALITGNTVKNVSGEYEGFDIYVRGGFATVSRNTAENVAYYGFYLSADDSIFEYNKSFYTGGDAHHEPAFYLSGDRNTITGNYGNHNQGDSCWELSGDDNLMKSNTCRNTIGDGFVIRGDRNRLERNVAQFNGGEGIENEGYDTEFYRNTSTSNRIDCADDGGTVALDSGNVCGDGSDLATTPQEIDY